ncbi:MAG: hypothetical protein ACJAY8_001272 [Sphingobacteriales bacterium]|jgi:hypothetical protein
MRKFRSLLVLCSILFALPFMVGLTPVDCNKTDIVRGLVTAIELNDVTQDIIINIQGNNSQFYINRGLSAHNYPEFEATILDKIIQIEMANHWSLLDPYSIKQPVCQIELDNQLVFPQSP